MRILLCLMMVAVGGCVANVDTVAPDPEDAGVADVHVDAPVVDHCGNPALEKIAAEHPEEVCTSTAACVAEKIGDTCICGLCVVHY